MSDSVRETQQLLDAPFPSQAIKRKQGKFEYVEHQTVTRRLNSLGLPWSFVVREVWFRDDLQISNRDGKPVTTMVVLGDLTIEGMGTRSGFGVANLQIGGGEDQYKGAESDAIKKAASRFGVGLDLYGPDYEAGEIGTDPAPSPARPAGNDLLAAARARAWAAAKKINMNEKDFETFLYARFNKASQAVTAGEFNAAAQWIAAQPPQVIRDFMQEAWAKVQAAG